MTTIDDERNVAEIHRINAETRKLFDEADKLRAEGMKLTAEARYEPVRLLVSAFSVIALAVFAALGAARAVGWL